MKINSLSFTNKFIKKSQKNQNRFTGERCENYDCTKPEKMQNIKSKVNILFSPSLSLSIKVNSNNLDLFSFTIA